MSNTQGFQLFTYLLMFSIEHLILFFLTSQLLNQYLPLFLHLLTIFIIFCCYSLQYFLQFGTVFILPHLNSEDFDLLFQLLDWLKFISVHNDGKFIEIFTRFLQCFSFCLQTFFQLTHLFLFLVLFLHGLF